MASTDDAQQKAYPLALRCSEAASPLPSGAAPQTAASSGAGVTARVTAVELWYEQVFSGMHMLSCEPGSPA
jgi:hypothetical protein